MRPAVDSQADLSVCGLPLPRKAILVGGVVFLDFRKGILQRLRFPLGLAKGTDCHCCYALRLNGIHNVLTKGPPGPIV
jgi:hypothetical protein